MSKSKGATIVLFSSGRCAHCERTRALLRAQRVPFQELDISRSRGAAARFQRLGARGVPVLLVGKQRIDGFQPEAIKRALRQAGIGQ